MGVVYLEMSQPRATPSLFGPDAALDAAVLVIWPLEPPAQDSYDGTTASAASSLPPPT